MKLLEEIRGNRILVSDGALGTLLQEKGLQPGECPELWNITHRNVVLEIAKSYSEAGSDIITTNSFGGNRIKLAQYGLAGRVKELNEAAAAITREAVGKERYVAGSIGPTGKMLFMGEVTEADLYDAFREQSEALEKGGADIIIIETMTAADEAAVAVRAAKENTKCIVILTMTFSKTPSGDYHTMMGVTPKEMVEVAVNAGAHITGSNCGNGIADMIGIVKAVRDSNKEIPVLIQANAGLPELIDGKTVFRESPELMASYVEQLVKAGVNIIGGCCGTTPEHIREIRKKL